MAAVSTSLSIALCLRCNPEVGGWGCFAGARPGHPAGTRMGACDMGHGDFSHGSWPVLVMSLYGSSSALPYCVLLYSVLRQRDCVASLRFGCPSAVACGHTRFHGPTVCKHSSYLPRPYRQIGRANGAIIPTNNGRAGQTQSRFRNAWCRHLYMATMASPVPVRSASIADGPLACFSQTHSQ